MKFMQRKKEAELRAQLREEQQRLINESHWVVNRNEILPNIISDESKFLQPDNFIGRRSFGNFNPGIENMMKERKKNLKRKAKTDEKQNDEKEKKRDDNEEQISPQEMAQRFDKYVGVQVGTKKKKYNNDTA